MARKKAEGKSGVAFRDLQKVAKELNEMLEDGGEKIKTNLPILKLELIIKKAAEAILVADDKISKLAGEVFEQLGVVLEGADTNEEEADEEDEEESEEEEIGEIQENFLPEEEELTNGDKSSLNKVAKELNKMMKLTTPIEDGLDTSTLQAEIVEICEDIRDGEFTKDQFSENAVLIFEKLGIKITWAEKEKPASEKPVVKKEDKPAKKKNSGPGVITSIMNLVIEKGPITEDAIVKSLAKIFPDRNPDAMRKTVRVQLPKRMNKEKGTNISKTEKGFLSA